MPIDVSNFIPNDTPNRGLYRLSEILENRNNRNREAAYRHEKDQEAEDWKKLNLIQGLTDLSTHQTGNDVANAIGNQKAGAILQKYTALAKTLSPAELQYKVTQDMGGLINGMEGLKTELNNSDEQLKQLKQSLPNLDIAALAKAHRADILNRRLKGQDFANPLEVPPPTLNLTDPETLSHFVLGNKNILSEIDDSKGAEPESVLMGKQGDYTKFEGQKHYYHQPNYDRTKFNSEGFYTGKEIPTLNIKSSTLPSDALPSSNGKPFNIIDKDVLDRFQQNSGANLELIKSTREAFPNYDDFNNQEKQYAKQNTLYNLIKSNAQSQLHPTSNVRPQKSVTNVNTGTSAASQINDLYQTIEDALGGSGKAIIRANELPSDAMSYVVSEAQKSSPDDVEKITSSNVVVGKEPDGKTAFYVVNSDGTNKRVGYLTKKSVNIKNQPSVKEKREVVKQGNSNMVTMELPDGRKGQIPEDKVAEFMKENPKAKRH